MAHPPTMIRKALRLAGELLYPPLCPICHAEIGGAGALCPDCWATLRFVTGQVCDGCARALPITWPGERDLRCEECAGRMLVWRRARAATEYEGGARELVLALKHGDRADLAPAMARWMARAARDALADAELILPVPLHWTRRLHRRLNQSAELARGIARLSGRVHAPGLLIRTRPTESQRGKSIAERRRNLAGAFAVTQAASRRIAGRRLLLVDDVMTTGATLGEAARVLREAGAASVDVLVFARA